jgi:class 3 adenylate cyclase
MSNSPSPIEHGYLVLADISGYTSFLTRTELDHAQEILSDLLEIIVRRFKTMLTIHKLEGDAVFAYAPEALIVRGETLLELIETTYTDFRERMKNVRRHTTCTCRACQNIPTLDLKFMVHHGDFVIQNIGGTRELAGSDVNLVHRLLKNHVAENTGWRAYVLFTRTALECMGFQPEGLVQGAESYEHLGEAKTHVMDLHARYAALMEKRHITVEEGEAILSFTQEFNAPPPVAWSWLNEPEKRALYSLDPHGLKFMPILRPGGRTGAGATTHCIHGKDIAMRETVLDWKPFDYYTVEQDSGPLGIIRVTFKLEALNENKTRLHVFLDGHMPGWPRFLSRLAIRYFFTRIFPYHIVAVKMKEVMEGELAGVSHDEILLEPLNA